MGHCNTCPNGYATFEGQCDTCRRLKPRPVGPLHDEARIELRRLTTLMDAFNRAGDPRVAQVRREIGTLTYSMFDRPGSPPLADALRQVRDSASDYAAAMDERGAHQQEMENR